MNHCFRTVVIKDMPLIDLNTDILKIQEKDARASLLKANASYDLAALEYSNNQKLSEKKLIADFDLKSSKTNLDIAQANLTSAEAQLEKLQIELNRYALILSPITGIVLARNVDVGDTVMSGSNSTTLFTLAEDLSAMEIHAEVDELDISQIREGMEVRFTVDAYAEDTFRGTIREVRLIPEAANNIVTYTVIVDAENGEGKLLPGMTASLEFVIEQKEDVLLAPNAAFRFQPTGKEAAKAQEKLFEVQIANLPEEQQAEARARFKEMRKVMEESANQEGSGGLTGVAMQIPGQGGPGGPGGGFGGRGSNGDTGTGILAGSGERKTLWYIDTDGDLAVRYVQTGATDGSSTEIIDAGDLEGTDVILRVKVE